MKWLKFQSDRQRVSVTIFLHFVLFILQSFCFFSSKFTQFARSVVQRILFSIQFVHPDVNHALSTCTETMSSCTEKKCDMRRGDWETSYKATKSWSICVIVLFSSLIIFFLHCSLYLLPLSSIHVCRNNMYMCVLTGQTHVTEQFRRFAY